MARFESFNVVVNKQGARHRILRITFGRDGTIYAIFPSFAHQEGLVGCVTMKAHQSYPTNIHMPDWGKVAGHAVKYSHHPDGRTHFSQTSRIRTEIKKQACPLAEQDGHLFTVQLQDLNAFRAPRKATTPELTLNIEGDQKGLKLVFWRYRMDTLRPADPASWRGNPQGIQFPDGTLRKGLFVAPTEGSVFDDYTLVVTPEEWKNEDTAPCLMFLGGFDAKEVALNHDKDTNFLAFLYPCSDPADLRFRLGSVDLERARATCTSA